MSQFFFFLCGLFAIAGAIGVVTVRNPFYAVLALVVHLFALAGLFLLLEAQFVAFAQIVVYAGAVMVLYVFVVGYIGGDDESVHPWQGPSQKGVALVFGGLLFVELTLAVAGTGLQAVDSRGAPFDEHFGTPGQIGELLLTKFLFVFEAASVLLLDRRGGRGRAGPSPGRHQRGRGRAHDLHRVHAPDRHRHHRRGRRHARRGHQPARADHRRHHRARARDDRARADRGRPGAGA